MIRPVHRVILMILLMSATFSPSVAGQEVKGYFFQDEGTTLKYERREHGSGELWWTHTEKIGASRKLSDGSRKVNVTISITSGKEKSPFKEPVTSEALIKPDGTVVINVADAAGAVANQKFSAFNFKTTGGNSSLSPDLKPGDTLPDIHAAVTWTMFKYRIDYTRRKVIRKEKLTVPAGTFDCIVIQEWKSEKGPMVHKEHDNLNWYALGYGLIRHDSFYPDGSLKTTEHLVSIKRK